MFAYLALFTGFAHGNPVNSYQDPSPGNERKLLFEQDGIRVFASTSTCQDQPSALFQIENQNNRDVQLVLLVNSGSPGLPDLRNIKVKAASTMTGSCETPELSVKTDGTLPSIQVTIVR